MARPSTNLTLSGLHRLDALLYFHPVRCGEHSYKF
jgi:hypothetical protein